MTEAPLPEIDVHEAQRRADRGDLIIDVREEGEWNAGHMPKAIHTPLDDLDSARVDSTRPIVAVCRSGNRSGKATQHLRAAGLDVVNMAGGMLAWQEAGLPMVSADGKPGEVE